MAGGIYNTCISARYPARYLHQRAMHAGRDLHQHGRRHMHIQSYMAGGINNTCVSIDTCISARHAARYLHQRAMQPDTCTSMVGGIYGRHRERSCAPVPAAVPPCATCRYAILLENTAGGINWRRCELHKSVPRIKAQKRRGKGRCTGQDSPET